MPKQNLFSVTNLNAANGQVTNNGHNHISLSDYEFLTTVLHDHHFRITIFGSARIKKGSKYYKEIFELAKELGQKGYDIVTGGGPGLMEAANAGHQIGTPGHNNQSHSIGLPIRLPFEENINGYLDIQKKFNRFSNRLDNFMLISNVVIVTPGGIGTCLELFYTWQLTQVKHICPIPIILFGKQWEKLLDWVKKYPLKDGLISPQDLDNIFVAKTKKQVLRIIKHFHKIFEKEGSNYCVNYKNYKLN